MGQISVADRENIFHNTPFINSLPFPHLTSLLIILGLSSQINDLHSISCQRLLGAYQVALVVKNPTANAGDVRDSGSIPGLRRFPGEGNGNPLQYSCLENSMDRGAWKYSP